MTQDWFNGKLLWILLYRNQYVVHIAVYYMAYKEGYPVFVCVLGGAYLSLYGWVESTMNILGILYLLSSIEILCCAIIIIIE